MSVTQYYKFYNELDCAPLVFWPDVVVLSIICISIIGNLFRTKGNFTA